MPRQVTLTNLLQLIDGVARCGRDARGPSEEFELLSKHPDNAPSQTNSLRYVIGRFAFVADPSEVL
jgi:hypothetical protein